MPKIFKIILPVMFLFFLLVWERTHFVKLNLTIEELREERDRLEIQVYSLEVSAESLKNYSRIEKLAKAEFNMLYPESKDIVYIKKGGTK